MAKRLSKRKNMKNWKKGLKVKQVSVDTINSTTNRKGIILT